MSDVIDIEEYKRRNAVAVDTSQQAAIELVTSLLEDVKAGRVAGFVMAVEMQAGEPWTCAGGAVTAGGVLWLAEMLRQKYGPR